MRVAVAIDSFKGCLTTLEAGEAVRCGILSACPTADVRVYPVADGGEGTVEAVVRGTGGRFVQTVVSDPLSRPVLAAYGILPDGKTAVIEMSAAAGITLLTEEERNPLYTTTYGVGELILHAIRENGCREFIIGIGGSATNDGGVGMLSALGYAFLDREGREIARGAAGLADLAEIRAENIAPELSECRFSVACDVKNPLCGENGCSAVYGPQKGATSETVWQMDAWLSHYAALTPHKDPDAPGAGAAGGMGFAFLAYLGGRLVSGIDLVTEAVGLTEAVKEADFVVTGEGRLDGQSCMGKAPVGVATLAKAHKKTVIAFSGAVSEDAGALNRYGIDAFFPILRAPCTLDEAISPENAKRNLKNTAEQVFRLLAALV